MKNDLLALAQDTLHLALKAGATAAEASVYEARSTQVSLRQGALEELEQSEARELGLRVFAGRSSATISGSVLTKEAREKMVERVVAMAKLAPADPYAGLASPEQLAREDVNLDLVSQSFPDATQLRGLAEETESLGLSVTGISKSNGSGASSSNTHIATAASNGFERAWARTGFSLSVSLISGDGTNMVRDYYGSSANHFEDLEKPTHIATMAAERTLSRRDPQKLNSQSVPVIFDRRVAASLLGHFAGAINGASIARGVSFLKDKINQRIFKPGITIIDDPHRLRGPSSRSFDGEGLATYKQNLIENGMLTTWLLDLRSARQLGLTSTASASRGLASNPSPTTSNLYMVAGEIKIADMIKQQSKAVLITEFLGSSVNGATGDYSRGASGFWIENGEIKFPVSEITVAGNLIDMFASLTPADDLEFRSSTNAPSCLIEGMTIAGR